MIINGKQLALEVIDSLKPSFAKLAQRPVLTALASEDCLPCDFFLKQKQKIALELGVELRIIKIEKQASQVDLIAEIEKLNQDRAVNGIIVQLPLPSGFDVEKICQAISPQKDVDGFLGKTVKPPAVGVIDYLFKKYRLFQNGQKIALVGKGKLVGEPIFNWLIKKDVDKKDIFVIDKKTDKAQKEQWLKQADIIISGAGKANLIAKDMVKDNVVAIDFGYDIINGKIFGDIAQEVAEKAILFTPTPGGTGPILVAMLFSNLLNLCLNME